MLVSDCQHTLACIVSVAAQLTETHNSVVEFNIYAGPISGVLKKEAQVFGPSDQ